MEPATTAEAFETHVRESVVEYLSDRFRLPGYAELFQLESRDLKKVLHNRLHDDEGKPGPCEVLTRDYIDKLGGLVLAEQARLGLGDPDFRVLEVGAGDGSLGYFLQEEFGRRQHDIVVQGTDNDWLQITPLRPGLVEAADYLEATERYRPQVVISSWMPGHTDFTAGLRGVDSVQSIILIGPPDSDRSGRRWETWGVPDSEEAPYRLDGFSKTYESRLAPQLNFTALKHKEVHSATVVFRRA